MLSQKQIENIHNLDSKTQIEILHVCAEALGLVDIDEYCLATGMKKRNVYYQMKYGKIKSFPVGKHVFPLINAK